MINEDYNAYLLKCLSFLDLEDKEFLMLNCAVTFRTFNEKVISEHIGYTESFIEFHLRNALMKIFPNFYQQTIKIEDCLNKIKQMASGNMPLTEKIRKGIVGNNVKIVPVGGSFFIQSTDEQNRIWNQEDTMQLIEGLENGMRAEAIRQSSLEHKKDEKINLPGKTVPLEGYIYLLYSAELGLYRFGLQKGVENPENYAKTSYENQRNPLEVITYFRCNDVNKMFRYVKKCFEGKRKWLSGKQDTDYGGNQWFELVKEDVELISSENISNIMENKKEEEIRTIAPSGYVVLFHEHSDVYHLRFTSKPNYRPLIQKGRNDAYEPVICFLTNNVEHLIEHIHQAFRKQKDSAKEMYFLNEEDVKEIVALSEVGNLEISKTITSFI